MKRDSNPADTDVPPLLLRGGLRHPRTGRRLSRGAVLLRNGRIVAVGAEAERNAEDARALDLRGALIVPGFVDAHIHFLEGALHALVPDLHGANTVETFVRRIADAARRTPPGGWILGSGWNEKLWPGAPLPHRRWIDPVTGSRPVFVQRHDLHMGLANGAALRAAGIDRETPDPPGGVIDRDPDGAPTGILRDNAMSMIFRAVPPVDDDLRRRALERAFPRALAAGLTGLHELDGLDAFRCYRTLDDGNALPLRIVFGPPLRVWRELDADLRRPGRRLRIGPLKSFLDGSLGSGTARFFEPYRDRPGDRGVWVWDDGPRGRFRTEALAADRAGHQLMIHAIGDEAVAEALDLVEELEARNGPRDRRFRIEHAQHFRPEDFRRAARLGVIASVQPLHLVDDGPWAASKIGRRRCRTTCAFRSLLRAGVPLAFGSDYPVAPAEPWRGVVAAVTRRTAEGRPFVAAERISLARAIEAATLGPARAAFEENQAGRIAPGYRADLTVLDPDPFTIPVDELDAVRIRLTVVGGRIAYG